MGFALRGQGHVAQRILEHRPSEICISAMTLAEPRYGAARRQSPKLHDLIDAFTANVAVMPFDDVCATHFGALAAELAGRGLPIGDFDALVAAHAVALRLDGGHREVGVLEQNEARIVERGQQLSAAMPVMRGAMSIMHAAIPVVRGAMPVMRGAMSIMHAPAS